MEERATSTTLHKVNQTKTLISAFQAFSPNVRVFAVFKNFVPAKENSETWNISMMNSMSNTVSLEVMIMTFYIQLGPHGLFSRDSDLTTSVVRPLVSQSVS